MPRGLDLHDLRAFAVVAEEGSIRKGAERLHVSQPPLSRRLQRLERTLGTRLLERSAVGVALTPAGETLQREASRLLADVEGLAAKLARVVAPAEPLRLAITLALAPDRVERVIAAWMKAAPGRVARVPTAPSLAIQGDLRAGRLDFALVGLPGDTTGLETATVAREPLMALLPSSHAASRRRAVSLAHLQDLPLFWPPRASNPGFHDACARTFQSLGFRPSYVFVDPGSFLTLERIARGEGFTLLNRSRCGPRLRGLAYRPLEEDDRLAILLSAAWKPGGVDAALARRLADAAGRALRPAS